MPIEDRGVGEKYVFGGVDSRSNPLNMPEKRALLCSNWVPNGAGWLEFRMGYTLFGNIITGLTANVTLPTTSNPYQAYPAGTYYLYVTKVVGGQEQAISQECGPFVMDGTNYISIGGLALDSSTSYRVYVGTTPGGENQYEEWDMTTIQSYGGQICLGWIGNWVASSSPLTAPIHSIVPYTMWDGTRYLLIGSATRVSRLNVATKEFSLVGYLPTSDKWSAFCTNGQIHIGTAAGVWFYDGALLRASGIRTLTPAEAAAVSVNIGISAPAQSDASGVTQTVVTSGGGFAPSTNGGSFLYLAYYDKVKQTVSPSSLIKTARTPIVTSSSKISLGNLPNLSSVNTNLVKIIGVTGDGTTKATVASSLSAGVYRGFSAGSTVTAGVASIVYTSHGLAVGDVINVIQGDQVGTDVAGLVGLYTVTAVADANHFQFAVHPTDTQSAASIGTAMTWYKVAIAANAATTLDVVLSPTVGWGAVVTLDANSGGGVPPTAVGGAQPGYVLYACIWNPVTQHCGDRVQIGTRLAPTTSCTVVVAGLPDLSQENPEFEILIGSTYDGGQIPYVFMDSGGNWLSVPSGVTTATVDGSYATDQISEMPYRNGIPVPMDKLFMVGDSVVGLSPTDPYVRVSGAADDPINPEVVGRPEQSWYPSDALTYPTREIPIGGFEYNGGALIFSRNFSVPLYNNQGVWDFGQGFPVGLCGRRAWAKTIHGPYWITGQKQLATSRTDWTSGFSMTTGPSIVSGEYESGLLAQIGDAYLDDVELVPFVDILKRKDELLIKAKDKNGVPFVVVHDFGLQDETSPTGQAYEIQYGGPLAAGLTIAQGSDVNGMLVSYAGGMNGVVYQLENGNNDAGAEFDCDYMGIVNLGPQRASISDIQMWGDQDILTQNPIHLQDKMDASGDWKQVTAEADKGDDHDFKFHNRFSSGGAQFLYLRIKMKSHSVDAPSEPMSDPPHYPLEDYGKIYMGRVLFGTGRGT